MTHTPGPWSYSQESVDPEWWIVTIKGGLIVANVNAHLCQVANARLIAAAPDMLEALTEAAKYFELLSVNSMIAEDGRDIVRAAIAKATGTT